MLLETKGNLLRAIQARAARAAASPSATRNQGKNVVKIAREFLGKLDLRRFGGKGAGKEGFKAELDRGTEKLRRLLPGNPWGLARKLLNIFLRDVLYTSYLSEPNGLAEAEALFEIPLDKYTVREMKNRRPHGTAKLPRWKGVRHLKEDD